MKKLLLPLLVLLALSALPSCSTKFNVAAPYKNITVVYGLLDRGDTAHYVRIQKAFLDDTKSALVMAKTADSSFFTNINVRIQRVNMAGVGLHDTIHLTRVDLNAEGYPKEQGTFFNSPNYAYKFKGTLDPDYIYRIIVTNGATGGVDSADAPIIDNRAYSALTLYSIDDTTRNSEFDFSNTNPAIKLVIRANYQASSSFNYNGSLTQASVAQEFIRFQWVDSNTSTNATTHRYYDYDLGYYELMNATGNFFEYDIPNTAMYNALVTGMGAAPPNIVRLMDRCQLMVYLASSDFYTYVKIQAQQGTGLTGNEIQPTYTNIKGKNVLGLFASRTMRQGLVTISSSTIEQLEQIDLMAPERIKGTVY